jgi:hypothetical protein
MKKSTMMLLSALGFTLLLILGLILYAKHYISQHSEEASGNIITELRQVNDFNAINIEGAFQVSLKQDTFQRVSVQIDDNFQQYIVAEVSDSVLLIKSKNGFQTFGCRINIVCSDLKSIQLKAGASITSEGMIVSPSLDVTAEGGTITTLSCKTGVLNCIASAGSILTFEGSAVNANINLNAGVQLKAKHLTIDTCVIEANAGSLADIYVDSLLSVIASSGSSVNYGGEPRIASQQISSGASIQTLP